MGAKRIGGLAAALLLGGLAAGCARGPAPTAAGPTSPPPKPTSPAPREVKLEMGEFFFKPSISSVPSGQVTFVATNTGKIEHELVVIKTDLPADALPVAEGKVNEEAAGISVIGEIEPEELGPGKTATKTFTLAPGKYVLVCNIAGHYQAGMRAPFTVQ
jgi:uncharacterized cupredoxin-like copper-binding protein